MLMTLLTFQFYSRLSIHTPMAPSQGSPWLSILQQIIINGLLQKIGNEKITFNSIVDYLRVFNPLFYLFFSLSYKFFFSYLSISIILLFLIFFTIPGFSRDLKEFFIKIMNLGQQPNPKRNKEKGKQGSYTGEHFPYIFYYSSFRGKSSFITIILTKTGKKFTRIIIMNFRFFLHNV